MNHRLLNLLLKSLLLVYFTQITVLADPGNLVDSPLFVTTNNVPPNVFFEVDDSGSMDWDILTKRHWSDCAYNCIDHDNFGKDMKTGLYRGYVDTANNYQNFRSLSSNTDNVYPPVCSAGDGNEKFGRTLEECSITVQNADWRIKSSALNVLYYNSSITYSSWVKGDGTLLPLATFTAARSDPQSGATGYNLTRNLNGFIYHVWTDTHGFSGNRPKSKSMNKTTGENGQVDWWDEHKRYTVNTSSIIVDQITYTGRGTVETIQHIATLSGSGVHALLGGKTITETKQNIANWYQYYRRRSFVAKSAIAKVITENSTYRYGLNFINNTQFPYKTTNTKFIKLPENQGSQAHNIDIIKSLFKLDWPAKGTPLRTGLERVGKYYENGSPSPITESCQKNFAILFTDGYWNAATGPSSGIGDSDGDSHSISVADVARYYYSRDLSSLNGDQNMTTFTVAFGLKGLLEDTDADGWPNPLLGHNSNWGDPLGSGDRPEKIDDLWHAAFNSEGKFVSAETPKEVADALADALDKIGNSVGSASSAAFSTTTLTADSAVFLAQFDTFKDQWSGDIKSFSLNSNGELSSSFSWSAATVLDSMSASNRHIFTYNDSTHQGISFAWDNLTTSQQADLRINPDGTSSNDNNDAKAKARLSFLRGNRSNEVNKNGTKRGTFAFRKRKKLLGDMIHSAPVFIGEPELFWPSIAPFPIGSSSYKTFKTGSAKTRTGVVYAGANDGMLHGFYSSNGREAFSYIPNMLFSSANSSSGIHFLTDIQYAHRYYVDMPLTVSDVYIEKGNESKQWRTILLGGGRKGSRGIFALDVTDPTQFSQTSTNANKLVLWEFDQNDDEDLGYTFSKPAIAMMNNGRWAAIFGNGYNNTGDGTASLFIVFLDGGANGQWVEGTDYLKITTKIGDNRATNCQNCNGLSTPQAIDINVDRVVDRIYAGDLKGNLWVFDVSSTNKNQWKIAYGNSAHPKPLFTATHSNKSQPITLKPILVKHPNSSGGDAPDVLVFFGTGQYLTDTDPANQDTQSFYGVWDQGTGELTPSSLVEQTFLTGTFRNNNKNVTNQIRVLSDNPVDYETKFGWMINLTLASGERVIVDPDIRGDLLFFNTWIPDSSPCGSGGSGFLMSVNQLNGGRAEEATFDLNNDDEGKVDADDKVTTSNGDTYAPSGQVFNLGLPASSSFLNNKQYTPGTKSSVVGEPPISTRPVVDLSGVGTGRLSWQELHP